VSSSCESGSGIPALSSSSSSSGSKHSLSIFVGFLFLSLVRVILSDIFRSSINSGLFRTSILFLRWFGAVDVDDRLSELEYKDNDSHV
jgi:hypothetical protein